MCLINCTVWCLVVQSLSCVWHYMNPWTAALQASLSFTLSWSLLKLCPLTLSLSIESVMPSNRLILCHPRLLPSVFPSIKVFSNESALPIRWPEYWSFSFSISLSDEYPGLISLGLTSWISLQSKRFSRVSSSNTVQRHQFIGTQLFYCPALISIHDYWKNHSFDYMDLCKQSDVSAF